MMEPIRTNLLTLAIIGVVCILVSIFSTDIGSIFSGLWERCRAMRRWRRVVLGVGCVSLSLAVIGIVSVLKSAPDGEETVIEDSDLSPADLPSREMADVLRDFWDADAASNWPAAEIMGDISRIAYHPPFEAEPEFKSLGFDSVLTMADASMLGYVLKVENVAVVVFRGTDDPADWIANLDRFIATTEHGPAHRGFYNAYQPLSPQVIELINAVNPEHIWITGHSLGGALAVTCAYELAEREKLSIDGLITFGQPMVARRPLTERIDELLQGRYVHYVNQSDIVPRIPPSFDHCGSLVWYDGGDIRRSKPLRILAAGVSGDEPGDDAIVGEEIEPLPEDEFEALQERLKAEQAEPDFAPDGTALMKGNSPFIRDHNMELYLDRVRIRRAANSE